MQNEIKYVSYANNNIKTVDCWFLYHKFIDIVLIEKKL